jgi:adenylosuccinate synthase
LSLTKLDILDGFDTVKICTGYTLDGEPVTDYPDQYDVLERIEPVYEELPGWKTPISEMREPGDLPAEAKAFIAVVERQVGIRVNVVGVGAERDDYLIWETS